MFWTGNPFNPEAEVVRDFMRMYFSPASDTSRAGQARHDAYLRGLKEAMSLVIAGYVNKLRFDAYPKLRSAHGVPGVMPSDCYKIIDKAVEEWAVGAGDPKRSREDRLDYEREVIARTVEAIGNLAISDDMEKMETDRHQAAVLAKEEPATEADLEWLRPMLEAKQKEWDSIKSLLTDDQLATVAGDVPKEDA